MPKGEENNSFKIFLYSLVGKKREQIKNLVRLFLQNILQMDEREKGDRTKKKDHQYKMTL